MPKSKNRKNHKKKVLARNNRLKAKENRMKKMQREMLEQIMMEAQKGKFEDAEQLPDIELIDDENPTDTEPNDMGDIELEL